MTGQKAVSHLLLFSRPNLLALLFCLILTLRLQCPFCQWHRERKEIKHCPCFSKFQTTAPSTPWYIRSSFGGLPFQAKPKKRQQRGHWNHCRTQVWRGWISCPSISEGQVPLPKSRWAQQGSGMHGCKDIVRELDNEGRTGLDVSEMSERSQPKALLSSQRGNWKLPHEGPWKLLRKQKKSSRPWWKSVTWDISSTQKHKDVFHRGQNLIESG